MIGLRTGLLLATTAGLGAAIIALATSTRSDEFAHTDALDPSIAFDEGSEPCLDATPPQEARAQATASGVASVDSTAAPAYGPEIRLIAADEYGHPLAGAVFHVLELDQEEWWEDERITPFDVDPLNEVLRRGATETCDEFGSVKIARSHRTIAVLATSGELGMLECFDPGESSPWFVYLRPRHVLEVRARDEHGAAMVDLPLEVHESDGEVLWKGSTDANGRAFVDSLEVGLREPDEVVIVTAAVPVAVPVERWVRADLSAPGGIDLVIPTGSTTTMRLVDHRGRMLDVDGHLDVELPSARPRAACETKWIHVPLRNGIAVLRGLPHGAKPFLVYGPRAEALVAPEPNGSWPANIDMPVEAEDELVRFAVLAPNGQPHAGRLIGWRQWLTLDGDNEDSHVDDGRLLADGRGEVSCFVDITDCPPDEDGERKLSLIELVDDALRPPLRAVVSVDAIRASKPDVPFRVHLQPLPLALAGRVIDEFGSPVVSAYIDAESRLDGATRAESLRTFAPVFTDADGRFEVFAVPTRGRIEAAVRVNGTKVSSDPPSVFEFGARDVELNVHSGATIEGRMLVDPEQVDRSFEIGAFIDEQDHGELHIWREGSEFRWRLRRLGPGNYELRVFVDGGEEPVHRIENVLVANAARVVDPRCMPLDLRGQVSRIQEEADSGERELRIVDARGMPIDHGMWRFKFEDWHSWCPWNGGAIRSSLPFERIAVWSPGCFLREGPAPDRDTTWTLEPVRPVELKLEVPKNLRSPAIEFSIRARFDAYGAEGQGLGWMFSDYVTRAILEPSGRTFVELPLAGKWSVQALADWNTSEGPNGRELQWFTVQFEDHASLAAFVLQPKAASWLETLREAEAPLLPEHD